MRCETESTVRPSQARRSAASTRCSGITRQGVHDSLSRAETALGEFERVTGCIARDRRTAKALEAIADACERLQSIPEAREAAQNILLASASIKE